jgi:hypothetical protein
MGRREMMVRHQAMLDSYRLSGPVRAAETALEGVGERLDEIDELIEASDAAPAAIGDEVAALRAAVDDLEEELDEAGGGSGIWGRIHGVSGPPTADELWQIERSWEELRPVIERVNAVVAERLPALSRRVYADTVRPAPGDAVPMPSRGR